MNITGPARGVKTVLAFGETLWDLLPSGPQLGGAPCNFAFRVNALGERGVVVTRLGRDELGRKAFERLQALGMDTTHVQWDDLRPTGTVPVTIDAKGVPDFTIVQDVAYDFIEPTGALLDLAARADCVCFGTLVQRSPVSRATLTRVLDAAGETLKLLDINLRRDCHTSETIEESLRRADVVKLNDDEARELARLFSLPASPLSDLAKSLARRWKLSCCLITLGERGALGASRRGEVAYVPGYRVRVVDTVGSGDAFTAGFLREYLRDRGLADCVRVGNALAAMVAGQAGATAPISPDEIEALLRSDRERIYEPSLR